MSKDIVTTKNLTIREAQDNHPWNVLNGGYGAVPYSASILGAEKHGIPHIQATHAVLHAMKSLGKIAAVLEKLDHRTDLDGALDKHRIPAERAMMNAAAKPIRNMAADLMTAALRLAHLFEFDLSAALEERAVEKNNGFKIADNLSETLPVHRADNMRPGAVFSYVPMDGAFEEDLKDTNCQFSNEPGDHLVPLLIAQLLVLPVKRNGSRPEEPDRYFALRLSQRRVLNKGMQVRLQLRSKILVVVVEKDMEPNDFLIL